MVSPPIQIKGYYFTDNWFDDISDSYVKAIVKLQDGTSVEAVSSWVIVAPPDFAPDVRGLVTLYDVMTQVAIENGMAQPVQKPSFTHHILPIINRFKNLKWVHGGEDPDSIFNGIKDTDQVLADSSTLNRPARFSVRQTIKDISTVLHGRDEPTAVPFTLTDIQLGILDNWVDGNFTDDLGTAASELNDADTFNKLILDTTVGQGFYPGIEGGIIVKNKTIYKEPFRFDDSKISSGDITGLMALPWQADFFECVNEWWPSQRPDDVMQKNGDFARWDEGVTNEEDLVIKFNSLGFLKPIQDGTGIKQIEDERSLTR